MHIEKTTRNILLVDDDADDRKYFLEAVKEIDPTIEVSMSKDGEQAFAFLTRRTDHLPDYIFLDLRMPRVNGKQFLVRIKADERLKNIPVIIYTTSREVAESEALHQMGAVHFISKPNDPDEIYYVLSAVLDGKWDADTWQISKP